MKPFQLRAMASLMAAILCTCAAPAATPPAKPHKPAKEPVIVSITTRQATERPRSAYVLAQLGPDLPDAYENHYLAAFTRGIEALGATVRTRKLTGLELDRSAAADEREAFAPDVSFTVVFNERLISGSTHRGNVLVRLVDSSGNELWRSGQAFVISTFLSPGPAIARAGEKAGKTAIEKLEKDRVFPGPI